LTISGGLTMTWRFFVESQKFNQIEQMMCQQVAEYLNVVRDALAETVQLLEGALFEIDSPGRHMADEASQEILKRASR
jgi:hypothetical protein